MLADEIPGFTQDVGAKFHFTVEYEEQSLSPNYPAVNSKYGKVNELNMQSPSILPLPIQTFSTITHPKLNDVTDISVLGSWDEFTTPIHMQYDGTAFKLLHIPSLTSGQIYRYYFVITTKTYEPSTFYLKNSIPTPYGNVGQMAEICFNPRCTITRKDHYHRLRFFSSPDIVTVEVIGSWDNYHTPITLHKDEQKSFYFISQKDTNLPTIPKGKHTFIFQVTREREMNKEAPLQFQFTP